MWDKLPIDIINTILLYDGQISYRNGKYINKIKDVDKKYPLILERMRFNNHRIYFKSSQTFAVTIHIENNKKQNIKKQIYFHSSKNDSKYYIYCDNIWNHYPIFVY